MNKSDQSPPLADAPADVELSPPQLLGDGFRRFERYAVKLKHADGTTVAYSRDVLRVGAVVGVLPIDPVGGEVVLIRQFRLGAHLATGCGDLVEIVAGHVEPGEAPAAAAERECMEEIGVAPRALYPLFSFIPTPGVADEVATIYLGIIDAERVPARAGAAHENEDTHPVRVAIDAALAMVAEGRARNAYLMLALQWLALNLNRLDDYAGRAAAQSRTPP